jgi:hypothetical protein
MTTTNPAPASLTLTVKLGPQGVAQFQKFLSEQHRNHIDAESIFPGYEFVVGHWPPVDFWEVEVQVGSARVVIEDVTVKLESITPDDLSASNG